MANNQDRSRGLDGSERNRNRQTDAGGLQGRTETGNANRGENAGRLEPYEEGGKVSESPQGTYLPHGDESGRAPDESVGRMTRSGGQDVLNQSGRRSGRGATGLPGSIPGADDTGETGSLKGTGTTGPGSSGVRGGRAGDTVGWQGIPNDEGMERRKTSDHGGSKSDFAGAENLRNVGNPGSMEREGEIGREGRTGGKGTEKGNLSAGKDRPEDSVEGKRGRLDSGKGDLPEQDLDR